MADELALFIDISARREVVSLVVIVYLNWFKLTSCPTLKFARGAPV